jgi:hypothetical protein
MAREYGAGIKAWGISNSLTARGRTRGVLRSAQLDKKNRKDQRVSAGYRATNVDENKVRIEHVLGNNHRLRTADERARVIQDWLDIYEELLQGVYRVTRHGDGEQGYLLVKDPPNPVEVRTLRKASETVKELGLSATAAARASKFLEVSELLESWAKAADAGEDW